MSEQPQDTGSQDTGTEDGSTQEVSDEDLPEDLQPTEDNPLARHPEQTGDSDDEIGADTEAEPETAPLHQDDAEYGGAGGGS